MTNHAKPFGDTILLDGNPLPLVTRAGVAEWVQEEIKHSFRFDQVRDPLSGAMKFRQLYDVDGQDGPFVLVDDSDDGDCQSVILFDMT